jgi:uncharacterized repeat protein (TIGR03803 family)
LHCRRAKENGEKKTMRNVISNRVRRALASWPLLAMSVTAMHPMRAQTFNLLYTFLGTPNGATPMATPLLYQGGIYGTTAGGGASSHGTVYGVNFQNRVEVVLHSFAGPDGADPIGGLVQDAEGNFYGVAFRGGVNNYGTVFEVSPEGTFSLLHSFVNPVSNGWGPAGTLAIDPMGNLWGTTYAGGGGITTGRGGAPLALGTVFEYTSGGVFHSLRKFNPGGALPRAGLYLENGELYGTTSGDDAAEYGGTVFQLGVPLPLYKFTGSTDGSQPMGGVIGDGEGNLYGTASTGGSGMFGLGNGVVFEVNIATGTETVLHQFEGPDGSIPAAGLARDAQGNLYGTTSLGGQFGFGTVFELNPTTGQFTTLYSFTGGGDGANPYAGVVVDEEGNVWGAASAGGAGYGTLFVISPETT